MEKSAKLICPECEGQKTFPRFTDEKGQYDENCPTCEGTGTVNQPTACTCCKGDKKIIIGNPAAWGEIICSACEDSGFAVEK